MKPLVSFVIDPSLSTSFTISGVVVIVAVVILIAFGLWKFRSGGSLHSFEIDEAEFGLGDQKIKLSPNIVDKQIAYKIWVELSTRKIGLAIDLEHDVISDIYDSWFNFFSVTRELIKEVPVQKFARPGTEKIVRLSIEVLNVGIRPHLTRWQARFRRWYDRQLDNSEYAEDHPQEIQRRFPEFSALESDLMAVNARLMSYREKMYELITRS